VDDGQKAQQVLVKLKSILENYKLPGFTMNSEVVFKKITRRLTN